MTPEQWRALTPQQQAWHQQQWQQHQTRFPAAQPVYIPEPAKPAVNAAAIISLTSGVVGLLSLMAGLAILLILFAPVALISGIVGEQVAMKTQAPGRWMSVVGILLGVVTGLVVVGRLASM